MFSNNLIRSVAKSSNEDLLKLSKEDWVHVIEANKNFIELPEAWRGDALWGKILLNRLEAYKTYNFCNSLELCCGNGFTYFSFKEIAEFNDECHFMDLSKSQLSDFKKRCSLEDAPLPNIIYGDIGKIPFPNNNFNIVHAHSYLHHLPDVGLYFEEVLRVLKDGGHYYAFHEPSTSALILETFPRSLLKSVDDDGGSLTDIWIIKPDVIKSIMLDSGFSEVHINPSGLFYNLLITPFELVFKKLGYGYNNKFFTYLKFISEKVDRLLPMKIRKKYCPSLCIVGIK